MTLIVLAGAMVGVGLLLLVLLLDERPASGPAALARLDLNQQRYRRDRMLTTGVGAGEEPMAVRRLGAQVREWMESRGLKTPPSVASDLRVVGQSLEAHIGTSVVAGVVGFILPLVIGALLLATGTDPGPVPVIFSIIAAVLAFALPSVVVASKANAMRRDMRHVVGSFLDLVAMNLSGGRGVPESLETAASISSSPGMRMVRDALASARLQGNTPWSALGALGAELRIDELRDLASALTLVAEDGAKVKESLFARAESMRQRELAELEGRAQARSQSMLVAQLLLCTGFLVFLIYPAVARVMSG